ncbi:MAG TPA: hypothetical protein ENG75_00155 [Nitrospirae bacterium]|nr:chaperone SurA precursor [bacterium BMS3Bbin08]HDH51671.1 hypothetical protein [Nitrospirota bacterium]HDK16342.1 hypothetical protein [Nitrospirota bacterium]
MRKLISVLIQCSIIAVCCSSHAAVLLDRVVAVVNDDVITWSELRKNIELDAGEQLKGLEGEAREKKISELEKVFLEGLIDLKLQLQQARMNGFDVRDSELDSAVADIKRKYNLTDNDLAKTLEKEGLTMEEYRTQMQEQILLAKIVNYEIRDKILVKDKEIQEYYSANEKEYGTEKKVRIRQLLFAANRDDAGQKTETEAMAEEAIKRIDKGEDFAKVTDMFVEENKASGGDLGYVSFGGLLKEIQDAIAPLQEGEVSRPFWSSAGLHIVKLEDTVPALEAEGVRNRIKETLFQKAFRSKYEDWLKTLREKASIEMNL